VHMVLYGGAAECDKLADQFSWYGRKCAHVPLWLIVS